MRPAALVQTAAERFHDGADAPFLAFFAEDIEVYSEPAVSDRPVVSSRGALADWIARVRDQRVNVTVTAPAEHGNGAVCEVIVTRDVVPSEVWRVALAVCVADDLIREVRAFWTRDAAEQWIAEL